MVREQIFQRPEADFVEHEIAHAGARLLGIQDEGIFPFGSPQRVVAVERPVAGLNGQLLFPLASAHIDPVVDAGRVGDEQRRARVAFSFYQGFQQLVLVGAHGHGGYVDIAVAHGHQAQVLLPGLFPGSGKLGDGRRGGSLGSLPAGIGIYFGIQDQDIHIGLGREHMIQAAVTDIVGPAVSSDDPDGALGQEMAIFLDLLQQFPGRPRGALEFPIQQFPDAIRRFQGGVAQVFNGKPVFKSLLQFGRDIQGEGLAYPFGQASALLLHGQAKAVAELGVIFKEGVGPGGSPSLGVHRVGGGGGIASVDGRAARSVGDQHARPEQLGNQLQVRGFSAAGASPAEFEERLPELAAPDRIRGDIRDDLRQLLREAVLGVFRLDYIVQGFHLQGLLLGRADIDAVAAAGAVQGRGLDQVAEPGQGLASAFQSPQGFRGTGQVLFPGQVGPDGGMRADEGALVAHDAVLRYPDRNLDGDPPFFIAGGARRNGAVHAESAYRQLVSLQIQDGIDIFLHVLGSRLPVEDGAFRGLRPGGRVVDLLQGAGGPFNGLNIFLDHAGAFPAVGLVDGFFYGGQGLLLIHYARHLEESHLHDSVDPVAHSHLLGNFKGVDIVKVQFFPSNSPLHLRRQALFHLFQGPVGVEEESAPLFDPLQEVVAAHVGGIMAGN